MRPGFITCSVSWDDAEGTWWVWSGLGIDASVAVSRLGYRGREAMAEAAPALAEQLHVDRAELPPVATFATPKLPPEGKICRSEPVDRRLGKNASWFLAWPGGLERVSWGDFSVADAVVALDTMPSGVLAVATYELSETAVTDPELLAGHAHLVLDEHEMYFVSRLASDPPVHMTTRGRPRLWLPVMSHDELANYIEAAAAPRRGR